MFETLVFADIGSAAIKLAANGRVLTQASRVALDPQNGSRVLAVGDRCCSLLNATPVYPVRGGSVANPALAAIMLRRLTLDLLGRRSLFGTELRLLMPGCSSKVQRLCAADMARSAGFRKVKLMDPLLCSAAGAGADIHAPSAVMTADLGRDKLSWAFIANGGILCEGVRPIGSAGFDRAILAWFASEHGLLIGAKTAEKVKQKLHLPLITVGGKSAAGSHSFVTVRPSSLRPALEPVISAICAELAGALDSAPPEAAADVLDNGLILTGGGANLFGLAKELSQRLGVPVRAADSPDTAAVCGAAASETQGLPLEKALRSNAVFM